MFSYRFWTIFCALGFLVGYCNCIFPCSSLDDVSRNGDIVLIDSEFEDCGFEGPLIGDYSDGSPISSMTFDFNNYQAANQSELWLNFLISPRADTDAFNRNDVCEATLTGYDWSSLLPLVEHAFSKMQGLEKIHWEMHIPITDNILRSLESNNLNCKLHYKFDSLYRVPSFSLINSTLLYALKADISYGYHDNHAPMDFVFRALENAPNLRELDLHLHADRCELGGGNPWEHFPS